jgi:hypothetical protein
MARKRILLGEDEFGNPIYGPEMNDPDLAPVKNGRNVFSRDTDWKNYDKERNGRNVTDGKRNLGLAGATTAQYGAAVSKDKLSERKATSETSGGNSKMLVDYAKNPGETTVPGQPGYNASKDPFREKTPQEKADQAKKDAAAKKQTDLLSRHPAGEWWQKTRGEKTGGSGLNAIHVDAWEARRLQLELESQRRLDEVLYPGSRGRQHSAGGTNLGSPSWSGSGGGAFRQGVNDWVMASGAVVGQHGVTLVEVLDSWNIYDGQ